MIGWSGVARSLYILVDCEVEKFTEKIQNETKIVENLLLVFGELYVEIDPNTAPRPNSFILDKIIKLISPPTLSK